MRWTKGDADRWERERPWREWLQAQALKLLIRQRNKEQDEAQWRKERGW